MEVIRKIHNKIKENIIIQIFVCVILCVIIIFGYFIINSNIDKKKFRKYTITEDINLINSIEDISINNGNVILDGYAFLLGKDLIDVSVSIVLLDVNSGKEIWPDMQLIERPDIATYFSSEYNYKNSGFRAFIQDKKIKDNECYEIIINLDYSESDTVKIRKTVSSNQFLLNGELYNYNPNDFNVPVFDADLGILGKVFAEGWLCFYQKDLEMFIYQYGENIYWIATADYEFSENGQTRIPFHIYTTETSKLPSTQIQYGFDNRDFYFEDYEYKDESTDPYRVAIRKIPEDYSVTYIKTGHYDVENSKWFWNTTFHLDNLFR